MIQKQTVVAIVAVVVGISATLALHSGSWAPMQIAGLALVVPGAILWIVARLNLGSSFAVDAKAKALVTRGLYSRIRNPIYVFGTVVIAGGLLMTGNPWALLLLLVVVPLQAVRARREARVLEAAFGDQYRAYREQTWF